MSPSKPKRKPTWYGRLFVFLIFLWFFGGVDALLLRDMPVFLCLAAFWALTSIPVARLLGKPENRWIEGVWMFVVVAGMYLFILFVVPTVRISPETTYLTAPRNPYGAGIDYFAAIEQRIEPTGPPEENGARFLLENLGRPFYDAAVGGGSSDDCWKTLCEKLKFQPPNVPKAEFVSYKVFLDSLTPEENEIVTKFVPHETVFSEYGGEEREILKRFVDSNAEIFTFFTEASRKPVFYIPMIRGDSMIDALLPGEQIVREIVRSLQIRCRYRLSVRDKDGAVEDLKTMYRLAALHRPRIFNTITFLIDNSLVGIEENSARSVLVYGNLTPEETERLKREIAPFRKPFTDAEYKNVFLGERLTALDAACAMFEGRIGELAGKTTSEWDRRWNRHNMKFLRTNQMLRYINKAFDSIDEDDVQEAAKKYEIQSHAAIELKGYLWNMMWYGSSATMMTRYIENIFIGMLFPALEALDASRQRRQIDAMLTDMAWELERYRLLHQGEYPETLDRLDVELPNDPYSNEPFLYEKTSDGYLLYSIGPNRVDEKGQASSSPSRDDIGIRVERRIKE